MNFTSILLILIGIILVYARTIKYDEDYLKSTTTHINRIFTPLQSNEFSTTTIESVTSTDETTQLDTTLTIEATTRFPYFFIPVPIPIPIPFPFAAGAGGYSCEKNSHKEIIKKKLNRRFKKLILLTIVCAILEHLILVIFILI